jgi:hypothetical protein
MRYLCRTVYGYATNFLDSPVERLQAYRLVNEMFGRCYAPWRFLLDRYLGRRLRAADDHIRDVARAALSRR